MNKIAVAAFAMLASVQFSQGVITLSFVYDPDTTTTTATYSGSWDAFSQTSTWNSNLRQIYTEGFTSTFAGGGTYAIDLGRPINGPFSWGNINATSSTGDDFAFNTSNIIAPLGYSAGNPINGSLIFSGSNLTALGLFNGEIGTYTGSGNTVNYTASIIPEPSALLLVACGSLLAFRWRRSYSDYAIGQK